jgi:hypothetical protein
MVPCSSIHTTAGMFTTPNSVPMAWPGSSSEGWVEPAASM